MVFTGFYRVLLGFIGFYRVLPSSIYHFIHFPFQDRYLTKKQERFLLNFTGLNRILLDFRSSIEFYRVSLGFTGFYEFYWVLLGFTGCHLPLFPFTIFGSILSKKITGTRSIRFWKPILISFSFSYFFATRLFRRKKRTTRLGARPANKQTQKNKTKQTTGE